MKKNDKISSVPAIQLPEKNMLATIGKIKWTNRYDCPSGYEYNDDGYVETDENYLQISVSMMPYLLNDVGEEEILFQNALALRILNPNKVSDIIEMVLKYKYKASYYVLPNESLLKKAINRAYSVVSLGEVINKLHRSIFSFQSIWCSKDCTIGGKKQIYGILRDEFIDKVRSFMPIHTKFKTSCVAEETEESEYAVNVYWKNTGLDRKNRSRQAVVEALELLAQEGIENVTLAEIGVIAGLSRKTVGEITNGM